MDFRLLNIITKSDVYPLPRIDEILERLGNTKYFTCLDLTSGFHQLPIYEPHQEKTAFIVPNKGLFHYKRMPFGIKNGPSMFQRTIDIALAGLTDNIALTYLDDVIIHSATFEQHVKDVAEVLEKLTIAGMKVNIEKCEFVKEEILFLGHVVNNKGVKPDPTKLEAVKKFPVPKTQTNVRQFLGLVGYYRRFIPKFARLAAPLFNLLKKDIPPKLKPEMWTNDCQISFNNLIEALLTAPILCFPDFSNPDKKFFLFTDASYIGIGAVLKQQQNNGDILPVAYISRSLLPAEKNYGVTEIECLAIVYSVTKLRAYLLGSLFYIVTDHSSIKWVYLRV